MQVPRSRSAEGGGTLIVECAYAADISDGETERE